MNRDVCGPCFAPAALCECNRRIGMTDNEFIEALLFKAPVRDEAPDLDEKRRAALDWLGERWLLHQANSPAKRNE